MGIAEDFAKRVLRDELEIRDAQALENALELDTIKERMNSK